MIAIADRARAMVLRAISRTGARSFVVDRTRRIGARAAIAIAFAFVLAATFPALALAIGPIVFGIPHVAASLRYLVVRRSVSRILVSSVVVLSAVIVAARVGAGTGDGSTWARVEIAAGASLFAIAAIEAGRRSGRATRTVLALVVLGAGLALALQVPFVVRLAFVHVHNLGVVVLWMVLFRRGGALRRAVAAALVIALVLLASGATLPLARTLGGLDAGGVDCRDVAAWLAPSLVSSIAIPLVLVHAFTDSVHYAFWLGVVPEEELSGQGTLTFRMTLRGLVRDFGRVGLGVAVIATVGIAALALQRAEVARNAYFVVAGFHGYVEGAMLVWLAVGGSPDRRPLAVDRERVAAAPALLPKSPDSGTAW